MSALVRITEAMAELHIEKIVRRPADQLITRDRFYVHLEDGGTDHIGFGNTVREAFDDACHKLHGRKAA